MQDRLSQATQARTAALEEAAYYRSKLSAFESGSTDEAHRLEAQRNETLEKRLAEALQVKAALAHSVTHLEAAVEQHSTAQRLAEEKSGEAVSRAQLAETSYARSLGEASAVHQRAAEHESLVQQGLEQIATLTASHQQLTADHAHLQERMIASDASIVHYLATLEQAQLALAAANVRADETQAVWTSSQAELAGQHARAQQLQAELEAQSTAAQAATARASHLERLLEAAQQEHAATALLAAGGLAGVIAAQKEVLARETVPVAVHEERVRAAEEAAATHQRLLQETRQKVDESLSELHDSRGREVQLQTHLLSLRSEMATLRHSHSLALADVGRHQALAATRAVDLRDASRTTETAQLKASLLRSLMSEHGLAVDDSDIALRAVPFTGAETPEELHQRVVQVQSQLEQRTRLHRELESSHDQVQLQLEETEQQLAEATALRRQAEQENSHLCAEMIRVGTASDAAAGGHEARAVTAEGELAGLQQKHQALETTHAKAVQYVKGTEKILRRMKVSGPRSAVRKLVLTGRVWSGRAHALQGAGRGAGSRGRRE